MNLRAANYEHYRFTIEDLAYAERRFEEYAEKNYTREQRDHALKMDGWIEYALEHQHRREGRAVNRAIIGFVAGVLLLIWTAPRVYKPYWIEPDLENSKQITFFERHWFGPTTETRLEARFNKDYQMWLWSYKTEDGEWMPFFNPFPD